MKKHIKLKSKGAERSKIKSNLSNTVSTQLPGYSMGGNILSGTLSGAAAGAAIAPPFGAIAGGAIGLASGIFKGKEEKNELAQQETDQHNDMLRQTRLGNLEPSPEYRPLYAAKGGEVPKYGFGGEGDEVDQAGKDFAYTSYFNNTIQNKGKFKGLGINELPPNSPAGYAKRNTGADSIATANPGAYYDMEGLKQAFPEADTTRLKRAQAFERKYDPTSFTGANDPNAAKYGVRSVANNPSWVKRYNGKKQYTYNYTPTTGFTKETFGGGGEKGNPVKADSTMNPFNARVYETVTPRGYSVNPDVLKKNVKSFASNTPRYSDDDYREELWAKTLGSEAKTTAISESGYQPSNSKDPDFKYSKLNNLNRRSLMKGIFGTLNSERDTREDKQSRMNRWAPKMQSDIKDVPDYAKAPKKNLSVVTHRELPMTSVNKGKKDRMLENRAKAGKRTDLPESYFKSTDALGNFTVGEGKDDTGKYLYYYDKWDFANPALNAMTTPTEVYDRMYYKENPDYKPLSGKDKYVEFNPYVETHAKGGEQKIDSNMINPMMGKMPNANVEDNESVQFESGGSAVVDGKTHPKGGEDIYLEPGSRVYSARLKNPATGNTFADDHKKLTSKMDKAEETLDSRFATRISKRTAERNLKNLKGKEETLFAMQQELNGEAEKERQQQAMQQQMMQAQQGQMQPPEGMMDQVQPPQGAMSPNGPQMASQGPSAQPGLPMGAYGMEMPKYEGGGSTGGDLVQFSTLPDSLKFAFTQLYESRGEQVPLAIERSEVDYVDDLSRAGKLEGMNSEDVWKGMPQIEPQVDQGSAQPNVQEQTAPGAGAPQVPQPPSPDGTDSRLLASTYNTTPPYVNAPQTPLPNESDLAMQELRNPTYSRMGLDNKPSVSPQLDVGAISRDANATYAAFEAGDNGSFDYAFEDPAFQGADQIGVGEGFNNNLKEATNAKVQAPGSNLGGYANTAMTIAPMLWNIGQGLFGKKEQVKPAYNHAGMAAASQMQQERMNIDPMLQANRSAYATASRNLAGRSRGEQLSGMSNLMSSKAKGDASIYAQANNFDAQQRNQGRALTAQLGEGYANRQMPVDTWNAQSRAMGPNMIAKGMEQGSQYAQTQQLMGNMKSADATRLASLEQTFPMLQYNGGKWTVNQAMYQQFLKPKNQTESV